MAKKVTARSTKAEIIAAYNELERATNYLKPKL
jgi:hypothetical protein